MIKNVDTSSQLLDRALFDEMRDREFRPEFNLIGFKYLREKAKNELSLSESYHGRAPYELLQNADDAGATRAVFILSRHGLAFCHDGRWFTVGNFRSLADGWSDKDPNEFIGHKGLGFRSVLGITPSPYVVRIDPKSFFAVKFSWALNNGHIQATIQRDPYARAEYDKSTRQERQVCPIMAIPGLAQKQNLDDGGILFDRACRGAYGANLTTMFWFPAVDTEIPANVLAKLRQIPLTSDDHGRSFLLDFLRREVSVLLPFLANIKSVVLFVDDSQIGSVTREGELGDNGIVTIRTEIEKRRTDVDFFQMRFSFAIKPQVRAAKDTPAAVRAMDEACVILSVKLEKEQPVFDPDARFHVYFPTEERTGLGFVVHGDFYLMPDRMRLMPGNNYNQWLLGETADKCASEFLTALLDRFEAKQVFQTLSPSKYSRTEAAEKLVSWFADYLGYREEPFIPTVMGPLQPAEVILPPEIDEDGFWQDHFQEIVGEVFDGKTAWLLPELDDELTRAFLELAQVDGAEHEAVLDCIEAAGHSGKPASWWYECYAYLANDPKLGNAPLSTFAGYRILPTADGNLVEVPEQSSHIVCFPPVNERRKSLVPQLFSSVFVFLDGEVAVLLDEGDEHTRNWIGGHLNVTRFEAADLLPRAIRSVAPRLYGGELSTSSRELANAWKFLFLMVDSARKSTFSEDFWKELGRFPVPGSDPQTDSGYFRAEDLIPAFLAYWPDSFLRDKAALRGIPGLRRASEAFLRKLLDGSFIPWDRWKPFFDDVGISATPKLLRFSRRIARGEDLPFLATAIDDVNQPAFTGERQADENSAVIRLLMKEGLWEQFVQDTELCDHEGTKLLQSLEVVEGLSLVAEAESTVDGSGIAERLRRLAHEVSHLPIGGIDSSAVFCRSGGPGGHSIPIQSYVQRQMVEHPWLPSSHGPTSSRRCFVRRRERRLISSGRLDEELGDLLLPYVVVDTPAEVSRLQRLGVEELEDAGSSKTEALIQALAILGEYLSTEWGQNHILESRIRWRYVRGAIQEIYRVLNQRDQFYDLPEDIKLGVRGAEGVIFSTRPIYYADPGSPIERAFADDLALLDADRPYPDFFRRAGIHRLTAGETVDEELQSADDAVPAKRLKQQIVNELAPYLLAPVLARLGRQEIGDVLQRRLERFDVRVVDQIRVTYRLLEDPEISRSIDYADFYLQRTVQEARGAVSEAHFTLFVAGKPSISLLDDALDPDALGAVLAPLFFPDEPNDEIAALFPRIVSRYYYHRGHHQEMENFLHQQLGVSQAAQEQAAAVIEGEELEPAPITPPPTLIRPESSGVRTIQQQQEDVEKELKRHEQEVADRIKETFVDLGQCKPVDSRPVRPDKVTPEQEARGLRGEEEILRRLDEGILEGFALLTDRRKDGCGYDFLCERNGQEYQLEVKTFASPNGRVIVSPRELQVAASNRETYFLVGILDEGGSPRSWHVYMLPDPFEALLKHGSLDVKTSLEARAQDIFITPSEGE